MRLSDFDYELPSSLIASEPVKKRDSSRLLVLKKGTGDVSHENFFDLTKNLKPNDILVVNESKVFPARLIGQKTTGGKVEILLSHPVGKTAWKAIGKGLKIGQKILFTSSDLTGLVIDKVDQEVVIDFNYSGRDFLPLLERIGQIPLPPYIEAKRENGAKISTNDKERYQTVYAKSAGSCAAPTAGLHFTDELLRRIKDKGVEVISLTLHVGLGTFLPVKIDDFQKHVMHEEFYSIDCNNLNRIKEAKEQGQRIIAVGTTTTRVLEHLFSSEENLQYAKNNQDSRLSGWTNIFIYPGFKFKCVDGLITNFHLPKSTLILLVSAFAGKEKVFDAYKKAIQEKYRFFSYGDAMIIV